MKGGVKVFFRGEKWDQNVYWNLEVLISGVTWPFLPSVQSLATV